MAELRAKGEEEDLEGLNSHLLRHILIYLLFISFLGVFNDIDFSILYQYFYLKIYKKYYDGDKN